MSEKKKRNAIWAEKRGKRYLGRYRDEAGKTRSVGTYDTKEQAVEAAGRRVGLGEAGDYLGLTLAEYLLYWRDSHLGEEKITPRGNTTTGGPSTSSWSPATGGRRSRSSRPTPGSRTRSSPASSPTRTLSAAASSGYGSHWVVLSVPW